jgi:hypothetical protein
MAAAFPTLSLLISLTSAAVSLKFLFSISSSGPTVPPNHVIERRPSQLAVFLYHKQAMATLTATEARSS